MRQLAWHRLRLAAVFADAAIRYWMTIFPLVRREMRRWEQVASAIPDPVLRSIALDTQSGERGNYDGAAAFAAFVPRRSRADVVRAVIAFQLAYDYADSLAERPCDDRIANGRALHESLHAALSPKAPHPDYYAQQAGSDDGGYLRALVDGCRDAVEALPSWDGVARRARDMSRLVIEFQALNHADDALVASHLSAFAAATPRRGATLPWWEAAAGAASSMVIFSLIAASATPALGERDAEAIEWAYVPWIGALHVLLDSLVDWPHDLAAGHHSLIAHYASASEMAVGMSAIADAAVRAARGLPRGHQHELLLVAMAGLYMARSAASLPHAADTTARLSGALGGLVWPVLLVHRVRGRLGRATKRK
jgi:tetraprenyl-beta-curcumene synthase